LFFTQSNTTLPCPPVPTISNRLIINSFYVYV
jgi:hypothetical protein